MDTLIRPLLQMHLMRADRKVANWWIMDCMYIEFALWRFKDDTA